MMRQTNTIVFVDFNACSVIEIPTNDAGASLLPTIFIALAQNLGDHSVEVPGHDKFNMHGGVTNGALSLGIFQGRSPAAAIFVGDEDGSEAWGEMDGLCHRVFSTPIRQLKMPDRPWAVLMQLGPYSDAPCEWLGDFALEVARTWVGRRERKVF
jgi:hypothetical protein